MKATADGVLVAWDEFEELLKCVSDGMQYNHEHMETNKRKRRDNRSDVAIDLWKRDRNRCVKVGNALVDAYKEMHPEANVRYATLVD